MWMHPKIFCVSEHHRFIGGEVQDMSGLCGFTVMGQPKGHKLSIQRPILYLLMKEVLMQFSAERIAI